MGIPILDVIWVIIRRSLLEKKSPFNTSDKKHLHFRLLDVGFSHRGAVLFLYALTIIFGSTTLFFKGFSKLVSLAVLAFVMIILGLVLVLVYKYKQKEAVE
jgi:UDP-GlcNAc:undecaprenyl-phosphate GlcNAc-1-phosphate transferase